MDDDVVRAMLKWPNVPDVFGWLSLDERGSWRLKGERIRHPGINAFIGRNYQGDQRGRYYLQNGPQRVFVRLEATPYIYRFQSPTRILTHTDREVLDLKAVWVDDLERLLLETEHGIGLLHDGDLVTAFERFETQTGAAPELLPSPNDTTEPLIFNWINGKKPVKVMCANELPGHFGFQVSPQP